MRCPADHPAAVVNLLESTPLGAPYATQKARTMLAGDFTPNRCARR
jgi:3-hydroxyisobutyrate dehydrogenase